MLMDHLPMGGISHLATKDDLVLMRAEFHTDVAELRTELYKALNAQTMKFITVMSAINALMFAGLKWG